MREQGKERHWGTQKLGLSCPSGGTGAMLESPFLAHAWRPLCTLTSWYSPGEFSDLGISLRPHQTLSSFLVSLPVLTSGLRASGSSILVSGVGVLLGSKKVTKVGAEEHFIGLYLLLRWSLKFSSFLVPEMLTSDGGSHPGETRRLQLSIAHEKPSLVPYSVGCWARTGQESSIPDQSFGKSLSHPQAGAGPRDVLLSYLFCLWCLRRQMENWVRGGQKGENIGKIHQTGALGGQGPCPS